MEGLLILVVIVFLLGGFSSSTRSSSRRTSGYSSSSSGGSFASPHGSPNPRTSGVITDGFQPEDRCICGGKWLKRENNETGGRFFSCSNYPRCRYTRDQVLKIRLGAKYNDVYCSRGHHKPTSGTVVEVATGRVLCQKCVDKGYVTLKMERSRVTDQPRFSSPPRKSSQSSSSSDSCRNGHKRTPENTYVRPDGSRECAVCRRDARRRST